jgi:Rrf2 family transcriptional regulator, nitric oxide-sensitive transcriptional repressor
MLLCAKSGNESESVRLTTRTNLAIRALMYCALNEGRIARSAVIAEACNASANHLAQVVNALNAKGYLNATRGRLGGVRLGCAAKDINVGEVFRLFEADVPFAECFAPEVNTCPLVPGCRLRKAIIAALDAFYSEMDRVTLEDLVGGNTCLEEIFGLGPADALPIAGCQKATAAG